MPLIVFSPNAADNSGSGRARQTGSGTPGTFALPADLSEPLLPSPFLQTIECAVSTGDRPFHTRHVEPLETL
ncbi:hypothetical protein TNIN_114441 [Trichonephila inaurata madagascariensis]|uniref:Uncharacterized protein n=1 Tax=Trichonephila inaurata madagascariensis TaxID=2747483 RepID=A0A8X6IRF2_9ARAC|nr:hypothetical protein TNIN_137451 [Trichonephila inaurata madagascariensis]GFS57265.1 hypothetical protein TNIN_114441 [Trichonephila inaurata madagascariensis]